MSVFKYSVLKETIVHLLRNSHSGCIIIWLLFFHNIAINQIIVKL